MYSSVSLSPILGKNEKVEQHIRKKIHKLLYVDSVLILVRSP